MSSDLLTDRVLAAVHRKIPFGSNGFNGLDEFVEHFSNFKAEPSTDFNAYYQILWTDNPSGVFDSESSYLENIDCEKEEEMMSRIRCVDFVERRPNNDW